MPCWQHSYKWRSHHLAKLGADRQHMPVQHNKRVVAACRKGYPWLVSWLMSKQNLSHPEGILEPTGEKRGDQSMLPVLISAVLQYIRCGLATALVTCCHRAVVHKQQNI